MAYDSHPITYSRAKLYSDSSSVRLGVAYRPTLKISDERVVEIAGTGEGILIRTDDIDQLIAWLLDVQSILRAEEEREDDEKWQPTWSNPDGPGAA